MAKSFKEARREMDIADGLDRDGPVRSHLNEEARDMRNAGRKLETSEDEMTLAGLVKRMQDLETTQRQNNECLVKGMNQLLYQMREILDEVEHIRSEAKDETHNAQQAALNGVNRAQQEAERLTIENINTVTKKSTEYIDNMVLVAKRRIERLALITLPDKLFQTLKWVVLVLALFILSHIAWQIIA